MNPSCLSKLLHGACFLALTVSFFKSYAYAKNKNLKHDAGGITDDIHSHTKKQNDNFVLVSTLDGKISALDPDNGGKLLWTEDTGPGSLLSSTISSIKITYDGQPIRLIPSLNGGLYRFDGESIEPFPITAEALLSTSVKLTDQSIITGGNEIRMYGINPKTGALNYVCEMSKCSNLKPDPENIDDSVLVVKRHTQTVRAIDPITGTEKWNFSVGRSDVSVASSACSPADESQIVDDDEITVASFNTECKPSKPEHFTKNSKYLIKFVVPEGIVCAVDRHDPNKIIWKHKLESPVVNAWELKDNQIEPYDLFDGRIIPGLNVHQNDDDSELNRPFLYLGLYNKQLYIQESLVKPASTNLALVSTLPRSEQLKLPWKPYSAASSVRTMIQNSKAQGQRLLEAPEHTAIAIRQESCSVDCGYYLFADTTPAPPAIKKKVTVVNNVTDYVDSIDHIVIMSLWHWWREVLTISLLTSAAIHFLYTRHELKKTKARLIRESSNSTGSNTANDSQSVPIIIKEIEAEVDNDVPPDPNVEFESRYITDFENIQCLGKGGFGIVFEAKNKMDDCNYAVKRIRLPNRKEAREKVMREVKALAKLDHPGIVRYFNTWQECPPPGWQEKQDVELFDISAFTQTPFQSDKNVTPIEHTSKFNILNIANTGKSGSFSCDFNRNRNESSASMDIVFENSNPSINVTCDKMGIVCSSGITADVSESTSQVDTKGIGWLRPQTSTSHASSVATENDSGCDDEHDLFLRNSTKEEAFSENRPQSLLFKREEKKLFLYIQMELCKKETLKDWMNDTHTRDKMTILDIYDQILSAVQYVHDQGLMHRDLKPSNIFFSMSGLMKIGDFGLVTAMTEDQADTTHTPMQEKNFHQNHTDQVGTQLYMSPEQIARQPYNHKVDIYSLGLILFELLVSFSTGMERVKVMSDIKCQKFPADFETKFKNECDLLRKVISHKPEDRPEACEIKCELLEKNTELQVRVARHVRSSSRTFSTSSNESL